MHVPKDETLASTFLKMYPDYNGKNVVVAIFDTGVDPGAPGLQWTPDGRRKIIDVVDATGSSDVNTSTIVKAKDGKLKINAKKHWKINPEWNAVDDTYHIGTKRGYEIYPSQLVTRLKEARKEEWLKDQRPFIHDIQERLTKLSIKFENKNDIKETDINERKELLARLSLLEESSKSFDDPGPIYDCLVFFDGNHWRAAIDSSGTGDFTTMKAMTNYRVEYEYGKFSDESQLNYALNIYDDGNVLSIVCDGGSHGTHVAGIVAAYDKDESISEWGVAPGAQIISVKIGDSRLNATETGVGISRGILAVLENKCDIVNMSFGEHAAHPNYGRPIELIRELVEIHGVMFVASVGNDGPALGSIKSPGGLSSCILGVGAYVSSEMMSVEYSMRETHEGCPYTWSSRGPSMDGDLGVNVFAPGGAITSVPQWTLMKKQLKNGTSMASPNCTGCIALMLSGLRDRKIAVHPYSIRRALENTSKKLNGVEEFAQGRGLIQLPSAFDYLMKNSFERQPLYIDVRVSRPGTLTDYSRGVCVRELPEVSKSTLEFQVKLIPIFHVDTPNSSRLEYDVPLSLTSSHSWIQVPKFVALFQEGRSFSIVINTRDLAHGEHYGEIYGFEQKNSNKGPLIRIPVTIVKPRVASNEIITLQRTITAGMLSRTFYQVPEGATWVDVLVKSSNSSYENSRHRAMILHLMQYEMHTRPSSTSLHKRFTLDFSNSVYSMSVKGQSTIEFCVAPMWNMGGGSIDIMLEISFRGIEPNNSTVVVQGGEGSTRVNLRSALRNEIIQPQAKLTTWTQRYRPTQATLSPCSERNTWPRSRVIYQMALTYKITKVDNGKTIFRLPNFNGRLYDSQFESQMVLIFDSYKKFMGASDAIPKEIILPKGTYIVRAQIRHEDYLLLKKFTDMILFVDHTLKDINVPVYGSPDGSSLQTKAMGSTVVRCGSELPVYIGEPDKLPKGASPGDVLSGRIIYGKKNQSQWNGSSCKPDGFPLLYIVPPIETKKSEPKVKEIKVEETEEEALRDFLLIRVEKSIGKDNFINIWNQAISTYPNWIPLLQSKLHHLDHEKKRHENLNEIYQLTIEMEELINPNLNELVIYYSLNQSINQSAIKKSLKEKEKTRYIDLLYRKARVCIDLKNILQFKKTFQLLEKWININEPKYLIVTIQNHLYKEEYGQAIQKIQKWNELENGEKEKIISIHKIYEIKQDIFHSLGWLHFMEYEKKWYIINIPIDYMLF